MTWALWGPVGARLAGHAAQFGLRPESLRLGSGPLATPARIERIEDLGHAALIFARQWGGHAQLVIRADKETLSQHDLSGGTFVLRADPSRLLGFDIDGRRCRLPAVAAAGAAHV